MSIYAQHQLYKNVFPENTDSAISSQVIFVADFDQIKFNLGSALLSDFNSPITGTFEVGEEVIGASSGASGTILFITDDEIAIFNISGIFDDGEIITGSESGATVELDSPTPPNFTIQAFVSYQDINNPPDPTLAPSPTNEYSQVMYQDEAGGVNYAAGFEYSPTIGGVTTYGPQSFKLLPKGAIWFFLKIGDYNGGLLTNCNIDLFNQN